MAANLSSKLTLDGTQHNDALRTAAKELSKYKREVANTDKQLNKFKRDSTSATGALKTFTSSLKSGNMQGMAIGATGAINSLGESLGKLGGWFGLAVGVGATFNAMLKSSDELGDNYRSTLDAASAATNKFFISLTSGNFDNFIQGMRDAVRSAREAYEALDLLETTKSFNRVRLAELQTRYNQLLMLSRDRNLPEKQRLTYLNQAKAIMVQQAKILNVQIQQTRRLANAKMNQALDENGLGHLKDNKAMQNWYRNNQTYITKYVDVWGKKLKEMEAQHTKTVTVGTSSFGAAQTIQQEDEVLKLWKKQNAAQLTKLKRYNAYINMIETYGDAIKAADDAEIEALQMEQALTEANVGLDKSEFMINKQAGAAADKKLTKLEKEKELILKIQNAWNTAAIKSKLYFDNLKKEEAAKKDEAYSFKDKGYFDSNIDAELNARVNRGEGYFNSDSNGGIKTQDEHGFEVYYHVAQDALPTLESEYERIRQRIQEVMNENEIGLGVNADPKMAQAVIDAMNQQLQALGLKPIEVHIETNAEKKLSEISDVIGNLSSSFSSLGDSLEMPALNAAGIIGQAIANIILAYSQALAMASKLGPWAWIAFGLGGLAQVVGIISQIHSLSGYANGGIVGGNRTMGDHTLIRANAGEMMLNTRQQARLFSMLDGGTHGTEVNPSQVVFTIKGNVLQGVLDNYNNKMKKVR